MSAHTTLLQYHNQNECIQPGMAYILHSTLECLITPAHSALECAMVHAIVHTAFHTFLTGIVCAHSALECVMVHATAFHAFLRIITVHTIGMCDPSAHSLFLSVLFFSSSTEAEKKKHPAQKSIQSRTCSLCIRILYAYDTPINV